MKRLRKLEGCEFNVAGNAQIHLLQTADGQLFLGVCELSEEPSLNEYGFKDTHFVIQKDAHPENQSGFKLYRAKGMEWECIYEGAGVFSRDQDDQSVLLPTNRDSHKYMQDISADKRILVHLRNYENDGWKDCLLCVSYEGQEIFRLQVNELLRYCATPEGNCLVLLQTDETYTKEQWNPDSPIEAKYVLQFYDSKGKSLWESPLPEILGQFMSGCPINIFIINESRSVVFYRAARETCTDVMYELHIFNNKNGDFICVLPFKLRSVECAIQETEKGFAVDFDVRSGSDETAEKIKNETFPVIPIKSYHYEFDDQGQLLEKAYVVDEDKTTVWHILAKELKQKSVFCDANGNHVEKSNVSYKGHKWQLEWVQKDGTVLWQKKFNLAYGGDIEAVIQGDVMCVVEAPYFDKATVNFYKLPKPE